MFAHESDLHPSIKPTDEFFVIPKNWLYFPNFRYAYI